MESEYVQAALSLLGKAGRMDLVRQEVLPARREKLRKRSQRQAPRKFYGEPGKKGTVKLSKEGPGGPGVRSGQWGVLGVQGVPRFVAEDLDFSGTPDLSCQGERRGRGEPGERGAGRARLAWGGSITLARRTGGASGGWPKLITRRRLAADAPGKRCRGKGFAPASAAASWERRPGPLGVQAGVYKTRTVGTTAAWHIERRTLDKQVSESAPSPAKKADSTEIALPC
ncbi:hypothetical protein NDU88_004731 [Pleurodeles waltl]|uniref:Uncharacterized protein n=1 Tax=Pleurodeles waltl TaxID=8319 RepID=A0AAV7LKZ0_PLEWA|nr:hypothetical protein NDU88_004731 [Pleurodeles waltl]